MADLAASATPKTQKHLTKEEICHSLLASDASDFFNDKHKVDIPRAAVLIPLFLKDNELFVYLTVRSRHMRTHGGEVAFPGGKEDKEDEDIVETALREAEEEIGLPRDQVEVISKLPPSIAKYGIVVIPIVGFISKDFVPKPNPDEVEYAFSVPLVDFLSCDNHSSQQSSWDGRHYIMQFFTHPRPNKPGKEIVTYGLTAHIAMVVAVIIYNRPPDFGTDAGFNWENPRKAAEETYLRYLHRNGYNEQYESGSKL